MMIKYIYTLIIVIFVPLEGVSQLTEGTHSDTIKIKNPIFIDFYVENKGSVSFITSHRSNLNNEIKDFGLNDFLEKKDVFFLCIFLPYKNFNLHVCSRKRKKINENIVKSKLRDCRKRNIFMSKDRTFNFIKLKFTKDEYNQLHSQVFDIGPFYLFDTPDTLNVIVYPNSSN